MFFNMRSKSYLEQPRRGGAGVVKTGGGAEIMDSGKLIGGCKDGGI